MNKNELVEKGFRNILDAAFVRDNFIPIAQEREYWNVVVFEAYRVIELTVKGMIGLTGYTHKIRDDKHYTHEIGKLVGRFCDVIPEIKEPLPFIYSIGDSSGNRYAVGVFDDSIYLYKVISSATTVLSSCGPDRVGLSLLDRLTLRIQVDDLTVSLWSKDKKILASTDASISARQEIRSGFEKKPDSQRIEELKEIGSRLLDNRKKAFYSDKQYSQEEAERNVEDMEKWLEAAEVFVAVGNV